MLEGILASDFDVTYNNGRLAVWLSGEKSTDGLEELNGLQDILTMLGTNVNSYYAHLYFGNSSTSFLTAGITGTSYFPMADWASVDRAYVVDFNGDGKSDIMLIKDSNCEVFTFDGYFARRIHFSTSQLNKNHLAFFADFKRNGKRLGCSMVRVT